MIEQITIEAINKAIAEFMDGEYEYPEWYFNGQGYKELKYHSSWDWLMPVVEKIGNTRVASRASYNPEMSFRIEIVNGYTLIEGTGKSIFYNSSIEGAMLNATYKSVYHFIQWLNKQQQ